MDLLIYLSMTNSFNLEEKRGYFRLISYLLLPLSALYYLVISLINWLYDRDYVAVKGLNGKVVSVGNLTLGGSGKTPLVEYIAKMLQNQGWRIALLSRGYARKERIPLTVVSDGKEILAEMSRAGDEPLLLAKNLPGAVVVVDKDRYQAGLLAEDNFKANLFILDDGFQYRKLKRDVNILVINGKNPFGNGWLFPAGILREPLRSLKRADAIVISEPLGNSNDKAIREIVIHHKANLSVFHCYRSPSGFYQVKGDDLLHDGYFKSKKIVSLSAIARPSAFEEDLKAMGFNVEKKYRFADHHYFSQREIDAIAASARDSGAEAIITTQKDAMRLQGLKGVEPPLIYLKIEMRLLQEGEFRQFLLNYLAP